MKPLAVFYARMSTDKQETSIDAQRNKVFPFFKNKYEIVEAYIDEGKSGSKDTEKRTAFLRMIRDLTKGKYAGKVKYVVCLDLSRFGRLDTIEGAEHKAALRNARVKLDTVIDGVIDWNTSIGRIVDSVKSEGNHDLSLLIGQKGLEGRIRVTKEGIPNQTTPYGMAKKVIGPTGEMVIPRGQPFAKPKTWDSEFCPGELQEAQAVEFLFKTFLLDDVGYSEMAFRLHKKGYPEPTGKGWRGDTVAWMLRNPVYAGGLRIGEQTKGKFFRVQNGQETSVDNITDGKSAPVIVWGTHTGIIDKDLFDEVQEKISKRFKARGKARRAGPYALTGIICCGNCGNPMYGQKTPDGRVIYRCHRQEVNRSSTCGYWIAYESDLLPYLLTKFPKLLRETATQQFRVVLAPSKAWERRNDVMDCT